MGFLSASCPVILGIQWNESAFDSIAFDGAMVPSLCIALISPNKETRSLTNQARVKKQNNKHLCDGTKSFVGIIMLISYK